MKTRIPILIVTFLTMLLSCNSDEIVHPEDSSISSELTIETLKIETIEHNNNRSFYTSIEAIELEHTLQWISYTTANVLYRNTDAKAIFLASINNPTPANNSDITIHIEDLIGASVSNTDPFKIAFRNHLIELVSMYYTSGCPFGSSESPEPPLNTGEGGSGRPAMAYGMRDFDVNVPSPTEIEEMVDAFIAYIITDECIEMYLPVGITQNFDKITSSAHPMNTNTMNNGYHTRPHTGCGTIEYETVDATVNSEYLLNANGPIIIARPTKTRRCSYENFEFDFTDFLN